VEVEKLGLISKYKVRDLWAKKDLGEHTNYFTLFLLNHGARLVKISNTELGYFYNI